jgi:hypothetical protein
MTVVTSHVDSVWVEASAVGRLGVPNVPVRGSARVRERVCSIWRAGGGGAVGGGTSVAVLGQVHGVPAGQPGWQHAIALHFGTETRRGSLETSSHALWQQANHLWPDASVHGGCSGKGTEMGGGTPGLGDIITVMAGKKAAA